MPRLIRTALCLSALTACASPDERQKVGALQPSTTATGAATTPSTTTTGQPVVTDSAALVYHRSLDSASEGPQVHVGAIVLTEPSGVSNLAMCGLGLMPCVPALPTIVDASTAVDWTRDPLLRDQEADFVGVSIGFGPFDAWYQNSAVPHWHSIVSDEPGAADLEGDVGIVITGDGGGAWGQYAGFADIEVSPMIEVTQPLPGDVLQLGPGDQLNLEWTPTGAGTVYLLAAEAEGAGRLFLLDDDGAFEFPVDALGLTAPADIELALSRWDTADVDVNGHRLTVRAVSEVLWSGTYTP